MAYLHKTPFFLRWLYPGLLWRKKESQKNIYLTFDDGPIPEATPLVLEILEKRGIKATFFCVGENIKKHPHIFQQIKEKGHTIGNHTFNHLNGWSTSLDEYIENVAKCQEEIKSLDIKKLFRPPYGKIKRSQIVKLKSEYKIIMWDVLSGDFDINLSNEKCLSKTVKATRSGSIVIFHDNIKALDKIENVLPRYIDYFLAKGYKFLPL